MKSKMKKLGCKLLALIMLLTLFAAHQTQMAQAAATTNRVPIICYTISTGRVSTYRSAGGAYSGYIDGAADQVRILNVYSNGWSKVKYPTARGYKTAYTQSSNLFSNTDFSNSTITIGQRKTVYRRSNLSQSLGTVYADDKVVVIGTSGNNTQIIYPISGGYKMGWISGKYSAGNQSVGNRTASVTDGYYLIKSMINTNYVLDVHGISKDNGANIEVCQSNGGLNQVFKIKKESDGYYSLAPAHDPDKRVDVDNGGKVSGTNILQWENNGSSNQRWKIEKTSDGYYSFVSKCNGLYMDVYGAVVSNGGNVCCHTGNGTIAQKFVLQSTSVNGNNSQVSLDLTQRDVQITGYGQVVDSFNGVSAKYIPGTGNSNTGEYCCAGLVMNYYRQIYGITVSNMFTGRTPAASSGFFSVTSNPKAGDIGYQQNSSGSGHWFIIKHVYGNGTYTIIEQNWKYASGGRTYCTVNRKVSNATRGFKVYRWSGRPD